MRGLALLLPLALLVAGCSSPPPEAPEGPAQLAAGDRWTETVGIDQEGQVESDQQRRVLRTESVELAGATYEAFVIEVLHVIEAEGHEFVSRHTQWLRTSDHALLRSDLYTSSPNGELDRSVVFDAPCKVYEWPLEVGASWSSTCSGTRTTGNETTDVSQTRHYNVTEQRRVAVGAGTFHAWSVEVRDEASPGIGVEWYAPRACGVVKSQTTGAGPTQHLELRDFRCASVGR
ncbi:MAG: hypothetical protein ACPGQL_06350 [Thermoplasmatota archaeon]